MGRDNGVKGFVIEGNLAGRVVFTPRGDEVFKCSMPRGRIPAPSLNPGDASGIYRHLEVYKRTKYIFPVETSTPVYLWVLEENWGNRGKHDLLKMIIENCFDTSEAITIN